MRKNTIYWRKKQILLKKTNHRVVLENEYYTFE